MCRVLFWMGMYVMINWAALKISYIPVYGFCINAIDSTSMWLAAFLFPLNLPVFCYKDMLATSVS